MFCNDIVWCQYPFNPLQPFDYESVTSYSLLIQAVNTEFPRHEAVVNVTVTVRDTNDNTPRFSMPDGYVRSVSESAPVGTPVGTVVATDNDGGLNGTVRPSLWIRVAFVKVVLLRGWSLGWTNINYIPYMKVYLEITFNDEK